MRDIDHDGYDPDSVRRTYDDLAADYAVRFGSELADADEADPDTDFLDQVLSGFPAGPVLDLGCGPAQISQYLAARGRSMIGIDFAPAMLAVAARQVPAARLIAADLLALPLRDSTCGAAIASYSLHHLPKARLGAALTSIAAVLRPGGTLVIITHGGSGEERLDRPAGQLVLSRYSPDELAEALRAAGLSPSLSAPGHPGQASTQPRRSGSAPDG